MRVKGSVATRKRRKKVLKLAKGYVGSKHALFRTANEQLLHSLSYAYRDRKNRKRDFHSLWIRRLNAALIPYQISYSVFIAGLTQSKIKLNRKMLAFLAGTYPQTFSLVVNASQKALKAKST